jgi:hypothetical protein
MSGSDVAGVEPPSSDCSCLIWPRVRESMSMFDCLRGHQTTVAKCLQLLYTEP